MQMDQTEIEVKNFGITYKIWNFLSAISVEPVLFLATFVMGMYSNLSNEYIFDYFANAYNLDDNTTKHNSPCSNSSGANDTLYNQVSSETSKWDLYLNCAGMVVACFSSTLLGAWSDKVGRKPALIICTFSFVIMIAVYCIVVQLSMSIHYLLLARLLCGLLGDYTGILGLSFAYISDTSAYEKRTFRMAIGEASLGLGGICSFFIGGIWKAREGYLKPFYGLLAITIVNVIYVFVRLSNENLFTTAGVKYLIRFTPLKDLYYAGKNCFSGGYFTSLLLLLLCFSLHFISDVGSSDVMNIYELSSPFCFSSVQIGYSYALANLGMLVNIPIIHLFTGIVAELWLIIIGSISVVFSSLLLSLSHQSWMLYVSFVILLLARLPAPILRSQMSRVVSSESQGALFSIISCAESILALIASLLYNGIYAYTSENSSLAGSVFFVGVACGICSIPVYLVAYKMCRNSLDTDYNSMPLVPDDDEIS